MSELDDQTRLDSETRAAIPKHARCHSGDGIHQGPALLSACLSLTPWPGQAIRGSWVHVGRCFKLSGVKLSGCRGGMVSGVMSARVAVGAMVVGV